MIKSVGKTVEIIFDVDLCAEKCVFTFVSLEIYRMHSNFHWVEPVCRRWSVEAFCSVNAMLTMAEGLQRHVDANPLQVTTTSKHTACVWCRGFAARGRKNTAQLLRNMRSRRC